MRRSCHRGKRRLVRKQNETMKEIRKAGTVRPYLLRDGITTKNDETA